MLARFAFASLLVACSTGSPPPSRGLYAPIGPPRSSVIAETPPAVAAPPRVADGVLRLDGVSTDCSAVTAVDADGGATLMCTFDRERGCALRHLGPDGEEIHRSDLAPGWCVRWVPRAGGGGFLVTRAEDYQSATITSLDESGKRLATTSLTSPEEVYPLDASAASDGGVYLSLQFRTELRFGKRRLGTTKFTTSGIVKLAGSLDRLVWSRLFETRRTGIAALLPGTRDGADALVNTRGPLVPGGPVNPPIDPQTGSVFGGDAYGWKAERVSLDPRGVPVARVDLTIEPRRTVDDAAQIGDALAALTSGTEVPRHSNLTLVRADGQRERTRLDMAYVHFVDASARTWIIDCDCTYDGGAIRGTWIAKEIGGAQQTVALAGAVGKATTWRSLAVTGDRIAAVGTTNDPATGTPLTFVALAKLAAPAAKVDLATLAVKDHLALAPACRGPRANLAALVAGAAGKQFDAPLAACGIAEKAQVRLTTYVDGGLRALTIAGASPEATACARRVYEPVVACPLEGGNLSFSVRLGPDAR